MNHIRATIYLLLPNKTSRSIKQEWIKTIEPTFRLSTMPELSRRGSLNSSLCLSLCTTVLAAAVSVQDIVDIADVTADVGAIAPAADFLLTK